MSFQPVGDPVLKNRSAVPKGQHPRFTSGLNTHACVHVRLHTHIELPNLKHAHTSIQNKKKKGGMWLIYSLENLCVWCVWGAL